MVAPVLPIGPMLDVRRLARQLALEPIELVRELQADAVAMLRVGTRRWRVAEADFVQWTAKRQAAAAADAAQARQRARHVAGKVAPATKRRAQFHR